MSWPSVTAPVWLAVAVMMVGAVVHAVHRARAAVAISTVQSGTLGRRQQQLLVEAARELLVTVPLGLVGLIFAWVLITVLDASDGAYVPHGVIR